MLTPPQIVAAFLVAPCVALGSATQAPAGHWSGRLETPQLAARIDLTLERRDANWVGDFVAAAPRELRTKARELSIDGEHLHFRAAIAEADVAFDGRIASDLVSGEIVVSRDGEVFARGNFALAPSESGESGRARVETWLATKSEKLDARERDSVLRALDELLRTKYVSPEIGARVADELAKLDFAPSESAASFAARISDELFARSKDAHLKIKRGGEPVADPDRDVPETRADRDELRRSERVDNFGFRAIEILSGNVGYVDLRRLVRADLSGDTLAAAMAFVANTEALILDLRECGGGSPTLEQLLIGYLIDGPTERISDLHRRPENDVAQLWTAPWIAGPRYLDRDVFVLTAKRTFSAAEGLAFDLRALKRATLVGETTGGGAHAGRWYPLNEHFAAFVPTTRAQSAFVDGDWEGTGVAPDVAVAADGALKRARELVLERRIANTNDPDRRRELESELAELRR